MGWFTAANIIRRIFEIPGNAYRRMERIEEQKLRQNSHIIRSCEIAVDSVHLIEDTFSPKTFFGRYDDLEHCIYDIEASGVRTQAVLSLLMQFKKVVRQKTKYTNEFIDRCPEEQLKEILKYRDKMTTKSYEYLLYWIDALFDE